jgi:hypothetical protein
MLTKKTANNPDTPTRFAAILRSLAKFDSPTACHAGGILLLVAQQGCRKEKPDTEVSGQKIKPCSGSQERR